MCNVSYLLTFSFSIWPTDIDLPIHIIFACHWGTQLLHCLHDYCKWCTSYYCQPQIILPWSHPLVLWPDPWQHQLNYSSSTHHNFRNSRAYCLAILIFPAPCQTFKAFVKNVLFKKTWRFDTCIRFVSEIFCARQILECCLGSKRGGSYESIVN